MADLHDRPVATDTSITTTFWRDLCKRDNPCQLVLWLSEEDLSGLDVLGESTPKLKGIYLSASLATDSETFVTPRLRDLLYLVYPFELPEAREEKLVRTKAWLLARKMAARSSTSSTTFPGSISSSGSSIRWTTR
jgi:hypothetical protein